MQNEQNWVKKSTSLKKLEQSEQVGAKQRVGMHQNVKKGFKCVHKT